MARLLPDPVEREGLALIMKEHGVDVATAVDIGSILYQRAQGADLYVVGGWRYPPNLKFFAAKHLTDLRQLRGARIGVREPGDLGQLFISNGLRKAGIDPRTEIAWVYDPVRSRTATTLPTWIAYRSGEVVTVAAAEVYRVLQEESFPLLLDPLWLTRATRPDKVALADRPERRQMRRRRASRLPPRQLGFGLMRDVATSLSPEIETRRGRRATSDEDSRGGSSPAPQGRGLDGADHGRRLPRGLGRVVDELVTAGELERPLAVEDLLRDGPGERGLPRGQQPGRLQRARNRPGGRGEVWLLS